MFRTLDSTRLFHDVRSYSPSSLRTVTTRVTSPGGYQWTESRDQHITPRRVIGSPWWVGDFRPDLQIAPVLPDLFIGSQDVAQDFRLLKDVGITHIVNLATAVPNYFDFDFSYKAIDIRDLPTMNIRQHFEEVFRFIDDARMKGGRVFVHCNAGISRASTICIGYLMSRLRMRCDEAFQAVRSVRPIICPNEGFRRQLKEYDVELFGLGLRY